MANASTKVGFLLIDDYALMSTAAALEPMRAANLLAGENLFDVKFLSKDGGAIKSSAEFGIATQAIASSNMNFDLVFVVAGGNPLLFDNAKIFSWLRTLDAKGVSLGGISGGSAILANANLLHGRRFTIHWQHVDALKEHYPMHLVEQRLYVIDRDRYTCAGGVAPLDMMLAIVASNYGSDLAHKVSNWFIHTNIRPHNDPQRIGLGEQYNVHQPAIVAAIDLMTNHLADPLTLEQLAMLCNISQRQLQRLFQEKIEQSTMSFYRDLRLEKARELLNQSTSSILEIAIATGFTNASHFSKLFKEKFGTTPKVERQNSLI